MSQFSRRFLMTVNPDEIIHFSVMGLLPSDGELAIYTPQNIVSLLAIVDDKPRLLVQHQFTSNEMFMLLPLLESYPYYCPYENLHASFFYGRTSEETVKKSRKRLRDASDEGIWDIEMRPVRNALSRTRAKLRPFGIEISSILVTGYMLVAIPEAPLS